MNHISVELKLTGFTSADPIKISKTIDAVLDTLFSQRQHNLTVLKLNDTQSEDNRPAAIC